MTLRRAAKEAAGTAAEALVAETVEHLEQGLAELRELARGIHPSGLSERGLAYAVGRLVERSPLPVDADVCDERLPQTVETAIYFTVAEGLTNVAKYAQASEATVAVRRSAGLVTVDITDDGIGGADAGRGSGLRGLADRVAALDGSLSVDSPAGQGTRLHVEIPVS